MGQSLIWKRSSARRKNLIPDFTDLNAEKNEDSLMFETAKHATHIQTTDHSEKSLIENSEVLLYYLICHWIFEILL